MKVKCIDNNGWHCITIGEEYQVIHQNAEYYKIIDDENDEVCFSKYRFKEVKDDMGGLNVMTVLNGLKQDQLELTRKISELEEQIQSQDSKKEYWTPKVDETYYYINSDGKSCEDIYQYCLVDNNRIEIGNVFQTEEQSEREQFERMFKFNLKKFAFENNEHEIDLEDDKWSVYYDNRSEKLDAYNSVSCPDYGQIYFTSEKIAEKAINEFKDDFIRYFTTNK